MAAAADPAPAAAIQSRRRVDSHSPVPNSRVSTPPHARAARTQPRPRTGTTAPSAPTADAARSSAAPTQCRSPQEDAASSSPPISAPTPTPARRSTARRRRSRAAARRRSSPRPHGRVKVGTPLLFGLHTQLTFTYLHPISSMSWRMRKSPQRCFLRFWWCLVLNR